MRKYNLLTILFGLLFASVLFAQPKIQPTETKFDFGNIQQGDVVTHNFIVKNTGNETLVIEKVKASCGCTAVAPDKNELEPGDSTAIKVKFDSHGRRGVQQKYVYIFSNDPDKKQLRLGFTTKILESNELDAKKVESPNLEISQQKIDFEDVKQGESKEFELYLINKGNSNLVIESIESTCDCIVASISKKEFGPGEVGFLKINFDSKGRNGEFSRTLVIHSNDKAAPKQTIVVSANVIDGDKS